MLVEVQEAAEQNGGLTDAHRNMHHDSRDSI